MILMHNNRNVWVLFDGCADQMTQEGFAKHVGIPLNTYTSHERGKLVLQQHFADKIAAATGINAEDLLAGKLKTRLRFTGKAEEYWEKWKYAPLQE